MNLKTSKTEKNYELLMILAGSLSSAEAKKQCEKWEEELAKTGKILHKTVWEARPLAYKIGGEKTGTYFIAQFAAEGRRLAEFENGLRLSPKVIRHLVYATPQNYEWREYTAEDLEHDFTKLKPTVTEAEEKATADKKKTERKKSEQEIKTEKAAAAQKSKLEIEAATEKVMEGLKETAAKQPPPKKEEPAEDQAALDKKLDDILENL